MAQLGSDYITYSIIQCIIRNTCPQLPQIQMWSPHLTQTAADSNAPGRLPEILGRSWLQPNFSLMGKICPLLTLILPTTVSTDGRSLALQKASWLTLRAQKIHDCPMHAWPLSSRKFLRNVSRCHKTCVHRQQTTTVYNLTAAAARGNWTFHSMNQSDLFRLKYPRRLKIK